MDLRIYLIPISALVPDHIIHHAKHRHQHHRLLCSPVMHHDLHALPACLVPKNYQRYAGASRYSGTSPAPSSLTAYVSQEAVSQDGGHT